MKQNIEKQNTKHRSTFAVLFYINRTKIRKDGMCQLLCKVSIDAEWAQIGTKVSVNPAIWNPEKGRADGRSENAVTVNRAIDDLTSEIAGHYDRIKNSLGSSRQNWSRMQSKVSDRNRLPCWLSSGNIMRNSRNVSG